VVAEAPALGIVSEAVDGSPIAEHALDVPSVIWR
jgi:hypothetical protein